MSATFLPLSSSNFFKKTMPAIALTDNTNVFGAMEFTTLCLNSGIQPIIGCILRVNMDNTNHNIAQSLKEYNYSYFETSSKNDIGVTELFEYASCKAAKHVEKKQEKLSIDSIELTHNNINGGAKRHSSCCGN